MLGSMNRIALAAAATLAAALGCTTVVEMPLPTIGEIPGLEVERTPARSVDGSAPFAGLVLEERLAGSLEELAFAEGLYVADVEKGSPAEAAGIRPGDRILSVNGEPLGSIDQWRAWLSARKPGERIVLEVERGAGVRDVEIELAARRTAELPPATRFVDRRRLRAVFESAAVDRRTGARIVERLPGSPLEDADLRPGDVVVALQGEPVRSANELVLRLASLSEGERVSLDVLRDGRLLRRKVRTFSAPRRLVRLAVLPLFQWRRDPRSTAMSFRLIDLWLLSLYAYEREERHVRHSLLGLVVAEWGEGELVEEEASP